MNPLDLLALTSSHDMQPELWLQTIAAADDFKGAIAYVEGGLMCHGTHGIHP